MNHPVIGVYGCFSKTYEVGIDTLFPPDKGDLLFSESDYENYGSEWRVVDCTREAGVLWGPETDPNRRYRLSIKGNGPCPVGKLTPEIVRMRGVVPETCVRWEARLDSSGRVFGHIFTVEGTLLGHNLTQASFVLRTYVDIHQSFTIFRVGDPMKSSDPVNHFKGNLYFYESQGALVEDPETLQNATIPFYLKKWLDSKASSG